MKYKLIIITFKYFFLNKKLILFNLINLLLILPLSLLIFKTENENYAWLYIALSFFLLTITFFVNFIFYFINTEDNGYDQIIINKFSNKRKLFIFKTQIFILMNNIFIFIFSIFISVVLTIYFQKTTLFIISLFLSIAIANLMLILFYSLFFIVNIIISNNFLKVVMIFLLPLSIFGTGVAVKTLENSHLNNISYKYNPNNKINYLYKYYPDNKKTVIEENNYSGVINNISLNELKNNYSKYNLVDWVLGSYFSVVSQSVDQNKLIENNKYNMNYNSISLKNEFYKNKTAENKNRGLLVYPIGIKTFHNLKNQEIKQIYKNKWDKLNSDYKNSNAMVLLSSFIKNNNLWTEASIKNMQLIKGFIGLLGDDFLLYWFNDRKKLILKVPDLWEYLKTNTSKEYAQVMQSLYESPYADINLKLLLKIPNVNKLYINKVLNSNIKPRDQDIKFLQEKLVIFNQDKVKINQLNISNNSKILTLNEWKTKYSIDNQEQWKDFVITNTFTIHEANKLLLNLNTSFNLNIKYDFLENDVNYLNYSYEYDVKLKYGFNYISISITMLIFISMLMLFVSYMQVNKKNFRKS